MKRFISILTVFIIIIISFLQFNISFANEENTTKTETLIVKTEDIEEVKKETNNIESIVEVAENIYVVDYEDEESAEKGLENLENNQKIDNVFEDVKISLYGVNSSYTAWGVSTTGLDHYTQYLDYKNKPEVKVAVLDTGINKNHEVFTNSSVADRIDTQYSYNYIDNSTDITDYDGHGTMVASVIAESTPANVKIVPVKALSNSGGSLGSLAKSLIQVKDHVDVINMSLGVTVGNGAGQLTQEGVEIFDSILKEIYDNGNGPIMICATGNEGVGEVSYPAKSVYTQAVGALKNSNNTLVRDTYSNYGNEVDFTAPGSKLYLASYSNNNGYVTNSGTSFSAPFVSAAMALIKTENPNYKAENLVEKLKENVEDLGTTGKDQYYGYGCVNFIKNRFEKPCVAKISQNNGKITANVICDDNIQKYAYTYGNNSLNNANWVNISNPSTNVEISTQVDKSGTYTIYFKDTEGEIGSTTIATTVTNQKTNNNTNKQPRTPSVKYRTHVQNIGWQGYVSNGGTSGTSGQSLRLEGINIKLDSPDITGGIKYRTHVQNIGWQNYVSNGAMSGTSGQSLRLEAIQISLTGDISNKYDVYYRVHCQNFGWLGWAKNGEEAGSAGYAYRLEAIQIVLVKKGGKAPGSTKNSFKQCVMYQTHVQNVGWQDYVQSPNVSGTTGQSLRLEGIKIFIPSSNVSGNIEYSVHVQNIGWQGFVKNNEMSGTSGQSLRLEGIKIRLTGDLAKKYDIYYRVHCENIGWMGWAKNGAQAGSEGFSFRLEGIQIQLVEKGESAPGSTANCFIKR